MKSSYKDQHRKWKTGRGEMHITYALHQFIVFLAIELQLASWRFPKKKGKNRSSIIVGADLHLIRRSMIIQLQHYFNTYLYTLSARRLSTVGLSNLRAILVLFDERVP